MTKKEALIFLQKKSDDLNNNAMPHDVLKWLRVVRNYLKNLFGEESDIYELANEHGIPNIALADYDKHLGRIIAQMRWLLDDCIELVNSGIVDNKFDKNFIYYMSDGAIATLITFIVASVFSIGVWVGSYFASDKEIKVSFSERPSIPVIQTPQCIKGCDTPRNNNKK